MRDYLTPEDKGKHFGKQVSIKDGPRHRIQGSKNLKYHGLEPSIFTNKEFGLKIKTSQTNKENSKEPNLS